MRSRELDSAAEPRRARRADAAARCSSARPRDRYDVLLEAFRKGATIEEVRERTAHRPVVPARAARRSRSTPTRRSPASAPSRRSTPARPSSPPRTPYYYSGWERRADHEVERGDRAERRHPRRRAQPHRPGHRVRLLLRPRRDDRPRVRPRRGDDQLQPRDGLDRLRHLGPPVLRAADARGRARRHRDRAARGRDRPVRRPDAAQARRRPAGGRRPDPRHERRRDRPRRGPRPLRRRCSSASATRRRRTRRRTRSTRRSTRARTVGFPLLVRPSLRPRRPGDGDRLLARRPAPTTCARATPATAATIFLDRFLENAIEVDVDALCDGEDVWIGGIMQHVEEAGIHSGDRACVLPPHSLGHEMLDQIRARDARHRARPRRRRAACNVQYAVHGGELYVIEANPRASRTVPFVSKAIGVPLAKIACRMMLGEQHRRPRPARRADARRPRQRQGGGAAVRPLRGLRRRPRPGDALDRRGHGRRARLPDRVRQGPGGGGRGAAARRARRSSRVTDTDKPAAVGDRPDPARPRLPDRRDARDRGGDRAHGHPGRARSTRSARARRTSSTGSRAATSTSSSTRRPARARAPTAGRSAAPRSPAGSRA